MLWLTSALAHSIVTAHNADINRRYKQDGYRLNTFRSFLAALLWLPMVIISPWPTNIYFYPVALFAGLSMMVTFTIGSNLAAKHNGRVALLHVPLSGVIVFITWLLISEKARLHFIEQPEDVIIALIAGFIMVFALAKMRRHDVSWAIFVQLIPKIFLAAAATILTRLVMPPETLFQNVPVFLFIVFTTCAVAGVAMYPWRPKPEKPFFNKNLVKASSLSAIGGSINHTFFLIAIAYAPNPAYVNLIALLTPFWLMLYHKARGIPDNADPFSGLILVLGAMALVTTSF
ncbi:MAG: hypothetical protein COY40_02360 [Alphaproteobacteria bacterium CG_4_10_14_0_8_um_filter_53_9]|nr:MAG: hypothetical protein COY40_02360 [Alphaproteobacteria bacterium CG_4_10_14_0_8_um_filter_53_9]